MMMLKTPSRLAENLSVLRVSWRGLLMIACISALTGVAGITPVNAVQPSSMHTQGDSNSQGHAILIQAIEKNREYLLDLCRKQGELTESRQRLVQALERPMGKDLAESDVLFLVHGLFDLGRFPQGFTHDTGFIEDDVVVEVLVSAMADPSKKIHDAAFDDLMRYAKASQLRRHSRYIKNILMGYRFDNNLKMLCLLDLDAPEKQKLLAQADLPLELRARLGDAHAQADLIAIFEAANTYQTKEKLARSLGYVGSDACAAALIQSLESPLTLQAPYESISIRVPIIKALGKIHPENELLTQEIHTIANLGDSQYGGDPMIQGYLGRVYEWASDTYGVKPGRIEAPAMLYRRILVKRPLKR